MELPLSFVLLVGQMVIGIAFVSAGVLVNGMSPSPLLPQALQAPLPSILAAWTATGLLVWLGAQSLATRRMARAIGQLEKQLQSKASVVPWEGLPLGASAPLVSGFDLLVPITDRLQGRSTPEVRGRGYLLLDAARPCPARKDSGALAPRGVILS